MIKSHVVYRILFGIILLIAIFLRFYNYDNRWGLAGDQAHDAIVARYALENQKIPLLGPFSSAGAFQTGGEWYWIIMFGTQVFPQSVIAPWVFITVLSVFFVFLIIKIGERLINKWFGLLVGALAAFSTAQITQSTNLTNQSPLALVALLAIFFSIKYTQTKKRGYLFFLGLTVSLASSIHLQGTALFLLIPFTVFLNGIPSFKEIILVGSGVLIPWIPVLWIDVNNNFYNITNMISYYLRDQYKISFEVLGRRWLTYIGDFIPTVWGFVIGGNKVVGYIIIVDFLIVGVYSLIKKQISKEWIILFLGFGSMIGLLRYTRTPLFDSYFVFLHPFFFLATGWLLYRLYAINKFFAVLLFVVIIVGSIIRTYPDITGKENNTPLKAEKWGSILTRKYPGGKFSIFDYSYNNVVRSLPLVLFLQKDKLLDEEGVKIGAAATRSAYMGHLPIVREGGVFLLFDLNSSSSASLRKYNWAPVNPKDVYYSTEEWYK